ncbi:hypothetical protein N566_01825, partial [Streptomycetaceae bacterium MP113-05]
PTAVRHLINLGHRRIGLITGVAHDPRRFASPILRRDAYRAALQAAGIPHDPSLEATGHFGIEEGAAAMAQLLTLPDPPTAVFAESDEMAFGALRTLGRMRLRCPEDVSVIGFDDHETAHLMDLTTIAQPVLEQGALLARMVLNAHAGTCGEPSDTVLPTRLVVRGTTGVARRDPAPGAPPSSTRTATPDPGSTGGRSPVP